MCVSVSFKPDARRRYKELNISVVIPPDPVVVERVYVKPVMT